MSAPFSVSVVMPVYNAEKFVETAIRSALQFEEVGEVVVVDDAGPDNSLAVVQALAAREPRIKLYQHPGGVNRGAGPSRNLGMKKASMPWITFLDADDQYLPNRFAAEHRVLDEHPDAEGVYGAIAPHYFDEQGRQQFERTFSQHMTTVRMPVPPGKLFDALTGAIPDFGHFHLNALTFKREVLERMDPWMPLDNNLHEDTDFMIRLAWYARLYPGSIDEPVALRGVHDANRITANAENSPYRLVLYKSLLAWARENKLGPRVEAYFKFKHRRAEISTAPTKWKALGLAWRYRGDRGHMDYREAVLVRLSGKGTRLTVFLHKALWRLWGPPEA